MLKEKTVHIVPKCPNAVRLRNYLVDPLGWMVANQGAKKAIKRGEVLVDGELVGTDAWIAEGQRLSWLQKEGQPPASHSQKILVVFEDEHLAVVEKPAGWAVSGNFAKTLNRLLPSSLQLSSRQDSLPHPRPIHRLDSPTSGLLLVGKTASAVAQLGQLFENREVEKTYHALVLGDLEGEGFWDTPVYGKDATTKYRVLEQSPSLRSGTLSLVRLSPKTGRKHQLRIHLARAGFPIVGDREHGREPPVFKGKGLFLAATGLAFIHPCTEEMIDLEISMPSKFRSLMERERRRWRRHQ